MKRATACLAEIGTIQIEFTRLSEITGNWKYHYVVSHKKGYVSWLLIKLKTKQKYSQGQHVYDVFIEKHNIKKFGLFPHLIDVYTGDPIGGNFNFSFFFDCIRILTRTCPFFIQIMLLGVGWETVSMR